MVKEQQFVDGDGGWISEESDFYGGEDAILILEQKLQSTDQRLAPSQFMPSRLVTQQTYLTPAVDSIDKFPDYFPREGDLSCRQSTETVVEFNKRLRPSAANESSCGSWIWITNPHVSPVPKSDRVDYEALMLCGQNLLDDFVKLRTKITLEMAGKAKSVIGRKITPLRTKLQDELRQVAINAKCTSGKWMLFPQLHNVDNVWRLITEAVIADKLGHVAKVATGSFEQDSPVRLICVYTKDFSLEQDVKRVLHALVELGVTGASDRGIYYKTDAYTHWEINSGNEYSLPASIYSSKDMLELSAGKKMSSTGFDF